MSRTKRARLTELTSVCLGLLLLSAGAAQLARARMTPLSNAASSPRAPRVVDTVDADDPDQMNPVDSANLRVLMVGNSYTFHHALHTLLQQVARGVAGGPRLLVDTEARGGYSLRAHLRSGQALAKIRHGHYSHVVLQGHSMSALNHPDELAADAQRFKQAIDQTTGRTVFYATWARSPEARLYRTHKVVHSFEEMTDLVDSTYATISHRLGAGLAPVGRAFERSLIQNPKLALWDPDGSHPTLAGSFMAACVLYGAITGADPRASTAVPEGLTNGQASLLRSVAAQALSDDSMPQPNVATAPAPVRVGALGVMHIN